MELSDTAGNVFPGGLDPSFTIELWVRLDDLASGEIQLISKTSGAGNVFRLRHYPDGRLRWDVGDPINTVSNRIEVIPAPGIVAGQWHHIAGTWNAANDTLKLYLDGVEIGSQTTSVALSVVDINNDMYIGGYNTRPIPGAIDEVRLSNKAIVFTTRANYPIWARCNPIVKPDGTATVAYAGTIDVNTDVMDPDGDTLTFSKVSGPTWLTVSGVGVLGGTPSVGGTFVFVVRADDGNGSEF